MFFQNRQDAGEKLIKKILQEKIIKSKDEIVVISLLRGGVIIGDKICEKLKSPHLILPVVKISSPHQEELAIGALCFDKVYWEEPTINSLNLPKNIIKNQVEKAKEKFLKYRQFFNIKKSLFNQIKNKTVIVTDDGVATGATVSCGYLFLKSKKPKKMFLAVPVAPCNFKNPGFDHLIIIYQDPFLSAISQYYQNFNQINNKEIKMILK